ncbi:uncharacterized protein LOC131574146 [Poecile atricapillus]|uniref:uncharacterized protein LOC131574146 n=1 Tax=Poecile atricapillus TaxID=48891 RepID=UPI00273967F6|nr:uncharacterized protein LOC131574146 [Poecile atricapillus]XP_058684530.1 uncharacterized protein LOC131574146 [Poecile atricapillus]
MGVWSPGNLLRSHLGGAQVSLRLLDSLPEVLVVLEPCSGVWELSWWHLTGVWSPRDLLRSHLGGAQVSLGLLDSFPEVLVVLDALEDWRHPRGWEPFWWHLMGVWSPGNLLRSHLGGAQVSLRLLDPVLEVLVVLELFSGVWELSWWHLTGVWSPGNLLRSHLGGAQVSLRLLDPVLEVLVVLDLFSGGWEPSWWHLTGVWSPGNLLRSHLGGAQVSLELLDLLLEGGRNLWDPWTPFCGLEASGGPWWAGTSLGGHQTRVWSLGDLLKSRLGGTLLSLELLSPIFGTRMTWGVLGPLFWGQGELQNFGWGPEGPHCPQVPPEPDQGWFFGVGRGQVWGWR